MHVVKLVRNVRVMWFWRVTVKALWEFFLVVSLESLACVFVFSQLMCVVLQLWIHVKARQKKALRYCITDTSEEHTSSTSLRCLKTNDFLWAQCRCLSQNMLFWEHVNLLFLLASVWLFCWRLVFLWLWRAKNINQKYTIVVYHKCLPYCIYFHILYSCYMYLNSVILGDVLTK